MNEKKFYKALLKETMTSKYGHMKYDMNKTYHIENDTKLKMCENGFHYTDDIIFILLWYDKDTYDIFEVIPSGKILHDEKKHKYCSEEITLIRQLSEEEIENMMNEECDKYVNSSVYFERKVVARYGRNKDLNILVKNRYWKIRVEVANHGRDKDLDKLVNDKNHYVRRQVARYGRDKDLDILVNDNEYCVREEVAKHGRPQDLDVLVNDKNPDVRLAVANHGRDKDLDKLVNDKLWCIRYAVAKHGRPQDLDVLANDKDDDVRDMVLKIKMNK